MKKPKIRTILVPIDFSKLSGSAIQTAKGFARKFDATIHLAHVHEFPYPADFMAPLPTSILTFRDDDATRKTRQLKMIARRNDLSVDNCHFIVGAPTFSQICNLARSICADLIIMPTHSCSGTAHFFAGSTAERIVQHAPCPVLVARPPVRTSISRSSDKSASSGIDNILVPVDFSQTSFHALEYAIGFAESEAARLIIFHAVDFGLALTADGYAMYDLSPVEESVRQIAEDQMQKFVGLAKFRGVQFETVVKVASPVPEICAFAAQRDVDLIITATHGRTGFRHLMIGSVAERVVRHAPRSVLVVPSHPDIRIARLAGDTQKTRARLDQGTINQKRPPKLVKTKRRVSLHPFPERRKINKFRESHSRVGWSATP